MEAGRREWRTRRCAPAERRNHVNGVVTVIFGKRAGGMLVLSAMITCAACSAVAAQSGGTRTLSIRNIHTGEVLSVAYKRNGRFIPEAMKKINWVMRDWRRNEATRMDPRLIDLLWRLHSDLGSKRPINLISGYRSAKTNTMLRRTRGGQARASRHILGKAADVQFPDIPVRQLRYAALIRERGGVGYYPTSTTPFVHVDTGRVRAWPRLPRYELALLFPRGRTLHRPKRGGPITRRDVRVAKARHQQVATRIGAFHNMRRAARRAPLAVASLDRLPRLKVPKPVLAVRPFSARLRPAPSSGATPAVPSRTVASLKPWSTVSTLPSVPPIDPAMRLAARPSNADRRKLTQLAMMASMPVLVAGPKPAPRPHTEAVSSSADLSIDRRKRPRLAFVGSVGAERWRGWNSGWAAAPRHDADHPEESAYRPFPLAPFLTETRSVDDPALVRLVHPDLARTGTLFAAPTTAPALRIRPNDEIAQLIWNDDLRRRSQLLRSRRVGAAPRQVWRTTLERR